MSKISELSDGGVIQGGDTLIAVRSGGNVKVTYGGTTTANIDGGTIDNTVIGGTTPAAGNFTTGSFTGNVSFGDNDKAVFGASSDLQIYHDGLNSHITDAGTGNLILQATDFVLKSGGTGVYIEAASGVTRLYHSNALKLATTTTGIDVTGTVTADGLSVNSGATNQGAYFVSTDTGQTIALSDSASSNLLITDSNGLNILTNGDANSAGTNATRAARFKPNKDVEFYEDTGTTAKFFWDASAESLGIGTASPSDTLEVKASGNDDGIRLQSSGGTNLAWLHQQSTDAATLRMYDGGNLNVLIGSNANANSYFNTGGNVGIGTSSPDTELSIALSSTNITTLGQKGGIQLKSDSSTIGNGGEITWQAGAGNSERWCAISGHIVSNDASGARGDLVFATKPTSSATTLTEAMRIDSSGNLLVGKTSSGIGVTGTSILSNGQMLVTADADNPVDFNRQTTDGVIALFRKDGTTVGSIQSRSGDVTTMVFDPRSNGSGITGTTNGLLPTNQAGTPTNDYVDLGSDTNKFKSLHLSGIIYGVQQTLTRDSGAPLELNRTTNDGELVYFKQGGIVRGSISISGSTTSYNTTSDYRLKENVVAMSGATERLKQLNPSRFNFIGDTDTTVDGFLAHEVADVVPEAITGAKDAVDDEGNAVYQGIDQSKLVPLLVATIQELEARIAALESN